MILIVRAVRRERLHDLFLVRPLRHGAADLLFRPVADKAPHLLKAPLGIAHLPQYMVRAVAQVLQRIEQRPVHIKKNRFIAHILPLFLFCCLIIICFMHKAQPRFCSYLSVCTLAPPLLL